MVDVWRRAIIRPRLDDPAADDHQLDISQVRDAFGGFGAQQHEVGREALKETDSFVARIVSQPKLFVIGVEDDLE